MTCARCGGELVAFAVPADLRAYAPGGAGGATVCASCLRVDAAGSGGGGDVEGGGGAEAGERGDDADFSAVVDTFPAGRGGVATALLLGKLDSLALNRSAVAELATEAERAGADPFLTLDRLASAPTVDPRFDIDRRRPQLAQLLE